MKKLTLFIFGVILTTNVILAFENKIQCDRVLLEAGATPYYGDKVGHVIHSLHVKALQKFKPDVTEDNHIPTINLNLTSDIAILPYAPLRDVPHSEEFRTEGSAILNEILSHMGDENYLSKHYSVLEQVVHGFHMEEMWAASLEGYKKFEANPPSEEVCLCATDVENNGILTRLRQTALYMREPVLMYNDQVDETRDTRKENLVWSSQNEDTTEKDGYNPNLLRKRTDSLPTLDSLDAWKYYRGTGFRHHHEADAALYLYCALNDQRENSQVDVAEDEEKATMDMKSAEFKYSGWPEGHVKPLKYSGWPEGHVKPLKYSGWPEGHVKPLKYSGWPEGHVKPLKYSGWPEGHVKPLKYSGWPEGHVKPLKYSGWPEGHVQPLKYSGWPEGHVKPLKYSGWPEGHVKPLKYSGWPEGHVQPLKYSGWPEGHVKPLKYSGWPEGHVKPLKYSGWPEGHVKPLKYSGWPEGHVKPLKYSGWPEGHVKPLKYSGWPEGHVKPLKYSGWPEGHVKPLKYSGWPEGHVKPLTYGEQSYDEY